MIWTLLNFPFFLEPLCVYRLLCYEFQKGLSFVSIVLFNLNVDELKMFNFFKDELHIVRTVGPSSKTLENIVSKVVLQAYNVVDE